MLQGSCTGEEGAVEGLTVIKCDALRGDASGSTDVSALAGGIESTEDASFRSDSSFGSVGVAEFSI
jgi:hypothetical protein